MSEFSTDSKAKVSWSKKIEKPDGSIIRIDVEKIENGFLKTTCKEGKNEEGEWKYETEKEFSEINPLEQDDDEGEEMSLLDKLAKVLKK